MIRQLLTCLLFIWTGVCGGMAAQEQQGGFSKADFYSTMQSGNEQAVNKQLEIIKTSAVAGRNAFEGALLMKKAGMVNGPRKKLDLFKAGHKKLEDIIKKDSTSTEFRFLRLMVQEHAPGITGYKTELAKDRMYILANFEKLQPVVQQAIKEYSKESSVLKPIDFNSIR
jgi:hypothetical protein